MDKNSKKNLVELVSHTAPLTQGRGLFITLEGVDGAGKTTQADLLDQWFQHKGYEVVRLREPGGTPISEQIRSILLNPENKEMQPVCELLLMEASRAQLTGQTIIPALAEGAVIICDRYFDSTFAYQSAARGLSEEMIFDANRMGSIGLTPDITFVFDIDPEVAWHRACSQAGPDRMEAEGLAFQNKVRAGYLRLASMEQQRLVLIDAAREPEAIFKTVVDSLEDKLTIENREPVWP